MQKCITTKIIFLAVTTLTLSKETYVLLWSDYWHTNVYETRTEILFKNTAS